MNREEYFEKILSILVELGVSGATILDSEGMGRFLAYEVPVFAGLRQLFGEIKSTNKTIITLFRDDEFFAKFEKLLAEEQIDFTEPSTGIVFTVPVKRLIKKKTG